MNKHESINYVELPSKNLSATKEFFKKVFGWSFEDYGHEYTAFVDAGLEGGFLSLLNKVVPKMGLH